MTDFIAEFCWICREWQRRTGFPASHVTGPRMVFTGGSDKFDLVHGDPKTPFGYYSIDQLQEWFDRLTEDTGMFDVFLAFIHLCC